MPVIDLQEFIAAQVAASTPKTAKQGTHVTVYLAEPPFDAVEVYRIDARELIAVGSASATQEDAKALHKAKARAEKSAPAVAKAEATVTSPASPAPPAEAPPMTDIKGIGEKLAQRLADRGFGSPELVRNATDEQLTAVDGVSPNVLKGLRDWSTE